MKKLVLIGLALMMLIAPANASFDVIRPNKDSWVRVDYAVDFARNNPGWGIVSISYNPCFYGVSHMVNYRILDNETILIHDEMHNAEFEVHNWFLDGQYYHFWIDEPIKRNYKRLLDNRELVM